MSEYNGYERRKREMCGGGRRDQKRRRRRRKRLEFKGGNECDCAAHVAN